MTDQTRTITIFNPGPGPVVVGGYVIAPKDHKDVRYSDATDALDSGRLVRVTAPEPDQNSGEESSSRKTSPDASESSQDDEPSKELG